MAELDVDIVAVERKIWSGKANVFTRTTSGEIGILPRTFPWWPNWSTTPWCAEPNVRDDLRIAVDGDICR